MELLCDIMEGKTQHGVAGCSVLSLTVASAHCNQKMEIISQTYISLSKLVRVGRQFLYLSSVMLFFSCAVTVHHYYDILCIFGESEENNKNHVGTETLWSSAFKNPFLFFWWYGRS